MSLNWLAKISKWFSGLALKSVKDFEDTLSQVLSMSVSESLSETKGLNPAFSQFWAWF